MNLKEFEMKPSWRSRDTIPALQAGLKFHETPQSLFTPSISQIADYTHGLMISIWLVCQVFHFRFQLLPLSWKMKNISHRES
jgi:hypothetical protein